MVLPYDRLTRIFILWSLMLCIMYGRLLFYWFNYQENLMKDLAKMVSKKRWGWEKRGFDGKALWNQIILYDPKKQSSPSCKYQWILILQRKWKLWKYYEIQVFWKITDGPIMRKFPRVAIGAGPWLVLDFLEFWPRRQPRQECSARSRKLWFQAVLSKIARLG